MRGCPSASVRAQLGGGLDPAEHRQVGRMVRRIGANIPTLDM
jgi:hypothetical protein